MGFEHVKDVRVGKVIDLTLRDEPDEAAALEAGREMARKLLANELVEEFDVEILG